MADAPARLTPRDISWLHFNRRVLQEAQDNRVPLYERLKFLAIYSSNLDEFFRVRVASQRNFKQLRKKTRRELDIEPREALREIRRMVGEQQEIFGRTFGEEILPALGAHGIYLVRDTDFNEAQRAHVAHFFTDAVEALLHPRVFSLEDDRPPFLANKGLYFIVQFVEDPERFGLVEIPSGALDRFQLLPSPVGEHHITFLDDIVRFHLPQLFPDHRVRDAFAVKTSRDAEMYIDDEFSGDLLEKIRTGLAKRTDGLPTRFLYDRRMPARKLRSIRKFFGLKKDDLIPGARYHNFNDFFGFPNPTGRAELHDPAWPPLEHPALRRAGSIFAAMRERDHMLHFPYQQYDYVSRLIKEAATDPAVREIRITLYRVASKSAIGHSLLEALAAGKQVTAFIEAKARFDEESNLFWGKQLETAGAEVLYSYPGIKVHTKLLQIRREEAGKKRAYTYIGTGNFNEKTAKLYTDHALLTTHKALGKEVGQVFDLLRRKIILPRTEHLLVSPFTLRDRFADLIDREAANARAGRPAYMILKMNQLEDPAMIARIEAAAEAGVRVDLIVRGICCLVNTHPNIRLVSIIDRFLEHARIYLFANGGEETMYIASADWMGRNLDRRVEVAVPIFDAAVRRELRDILELQLADTVKARHIDAAHAHPYAEGKPLRAQEAIYAYLKAKLEEQPRRRNALIVEDRTS